MSVLESQRSEDCNFTKRETLVSLISSEFCKILRNTFFYRTISVAASLFGAPVTATQQNIIFEIAYK